MPVANANGIDLYYEQQGERGEPLVLIHGGWMDHLTWSAAIPGLSANFRVLAYDRRGHGRSQKAATPGSFDEDADDAAALIADLGLAPAHVVGNSTGSIVALHLAARRPDVLRSLIVHEPPLWNLPSGDPDLAAAVADPRQKMDAVVKVIETGDMAGGARLFAESTPAFGPGGWERVPPPVKETLIANAGNILEEYRDPQGFSVDVRALSEFRRPTRLSYGGRSAPYFRPVLETLARSMPRAEVFVDRDAGHLPHLSHPEVFVRDVTTFVQSLD